VQDPQKPFIWVFVCQEDDFILEEVCGGEVPYMGYTPDLCSISTTW